MAAVGAEVTELSFLSPGVVSFFILLLLLSIFLTALCSNCGRHSFELQDSQGKSPSDLIRVVKLEEVMVARENPMISEIQKDEKEFKPAEENTASFPPWRSHLGAPQSHQDVWTNGRTAGDGETARGVNSPAPPDPDHIYHVIGGGRGIGGGDADVSSPPTNHEPGAHPAVDLSDRDRNSVYARVSKKMQAPAPPAHTPEEVEEEEEESSPPLPDRKTQLEG